MAGQVWGLGRHGDWAGMGVKRKMAEIMELCTSAVMTIVCHYAPAMV